MVVGMKKKELIEVFPFNKSETFQEGLNRISDDAFLLSPGKVSHQKLAISIVVLNSKTEHLNKLVSKFETGNFFHFHCLQDRKLQCAANSSDSV